MKEKFLTAENYYDNYGGWDLRLMLERIQNIPIPEVIREQIRSKEKANILVLGSATSDNLSRISQIDSYLRPGKVEHDSATIIDLNIYPLVKHKAGILSIEGKDGWSNTPKSTPEFPFPQFHLAQADMRELPFSNQTVDIMISDYTLNFLQRREDLEMTFKEISRTLAQDGIILISFRGNEKYPYQQKEQITPEDDLQIKQLFGITAFYFSIQSYLKIADEVGLDVVGIDVIGTDICAVMTKKSFNNVP